MTMIEPGTQVVATISAVMGDTLPGGQAATIVDEGGAKCVIPGPSRDGVAIAPIDPDRPTLEQVLAEHRLRHIPGECACGWSATPAGWTGSGPHAEHLAAELRAAGVAS